VRDDGFRAGVVATSQQGWQAEAPRDDRSPTVTHVSPVFERGLRRSEKKAQESAWCIHLLDSWCNVPYQTLLRYLTGHDHSLPADDHALGPVLRLAGIS